jgi:hypothetical protein
LNINYLIPTSGSLKISIWTERSSKKEQF